MSLLRLMLAGLAYHWRIHGAVALGVMAATAVLTGALLVGDSVRGSLRHMTLDRLGRIDEALLAEQFFREELAGKLARDPEFGHSFDAAAPAIYLQGTVERPGEERATRASQVTILGVDSRFWKLGNEPPAADVAAGEVVLNEPLADELGAAVGDEVLLRLPVKSDIPSDSPLGKKTDNARSARVRVSAIIPATGLGRFGVRPSQQLPLCAFAALETVQQMLDQRGKVNAIFVAGLSDRGSTVEESDRLAEVLARQVAPIDYGLSIARVRIGGNGVPASDYYNITSQALLLPPKVVAAAHDAFADDGLQSALTYLANTIRTGKKPIPYSTVAGLNVSPKLGPYPLPGKPLADDEIVLNGWAAEDLGVKPGDEIGVSFYEPESTHGKLVEPPPVKFRLRAIAPLGAPDAPPTQANDPYMTPELKGVTDKKSIANWDLPFELVEEIRRTDEDYWEDYRTTPKAYITLARARQLWSSRFGDTTSLRIPARPGLNEGEIFARLKLTPDELGLRFLPVKRHGLMAAAGTTPFNLLFLGFSFFIIAAAVMLTVLLFRLGVEQRVREIGIAAATGLRQNSILRWLLGEGAVVAAIGALAGVLLGIAYAWLMLAGLRTWWLAAVSTPFLQLHITGQSLAIGYAAGLLVSLAAVWWSLRRTKRSSVRGLLAGQSDEATGTQRGRGWWSRLLPAAMLAGAISLAIVGMQLGGQAQAGAFFGSGALMLAGLLTWIAAIFRGGTLQRSMNMPAGPIVMLLPRERSFAQRRFALAGLAVRNGARNPSRSTLTIGLVAAASFLIVAIGAFRLDTTEQGVGGFALVAESDNPVVPDLNTPIGRSDLGFSDRDARWIALCNTFSLRVRAGDDASCLNLYQPTQPRVLGVPQSFIERGGFAWAGNLAESPAERANPWLVLDRKLPDGAVPIVIDAATATYSLHLSGVGANYEIDDGHGGKLKLQVVGLLQNSLFQGDLLMSETNFLRHFPETAGYRFFLLETPSGEELEHKLAAPVAELEAKIARLKEFNHGSDLDESLRPLNEQLAELRSAAGDEKALRLRVAQALEATLGDYGFDATGADERLAGFLAVQNTYLSTFQSLGALGLLLGTFGVAVVQLRSVLERRRELALLRAAGFRRAVLARLVLWENALLLVGGLAVGVIAALVAISPQLIAGGAAFPWRWVTAMLAIVLAVGLIAGLAAVRAVVRTPVLEALRNE